MKHNTAANMKAVVSAVKKGGYGVWEESLTGENV